MFLRVPSLRFLSVLAFLAAAAGLLAACSDNAKGWSGTDIAGNLPDLQFTMTRAEDGKTVTAADYRGKVVLLYFGYTFCPDICPLTLSNVAGALQSMGDKADGVRMLFVTVDPNRDTLDVLKQYAAAFAPQVVGLRGSADQLASLAKRYRVAYSVDPNGANGEYVVTHSPAIYAFDKKGKARMLYTNLSTADADTKGLVADLKRLVAGHEAGGLFSWL